MFRINTSIIIMCNMPHDCMMILAHVNEIRNRSGLAIAGLDEFGLNLDSCVTHLKGGGCK